MIPLYRKVEMSLSRVIVWSRFTASINMLLQGSTILPANKLQGENLKAPRGRSLWLALFWELWERRLCVLRVLITGGAGFIGSHVVRACIKAGHEVLVIDNLVRGRKENLPVRVEFCRLDIAVEKEYEALKQVFRSFQPEAVIHLAAQVDVQVSLKQPLVDASVNILGLLRVLEACRAIGAKVVYASSAAVYGQPVSLPITEDHPVAALSPYGLSKYMGEMYLKLYEQQYGLNFTILRYANVYGPGQDSTGEGGVVAIFTDRMSNGNAPVIYGDGKQTRDFVYVKDVARANLLALNKGRGETINISTGMQTSVSELLAQLAGILKWAGGTIYAPARPGDIYASCLANQKAKRILGWQPRYELKEGLEDMLLGT